MDTFEILHQWDLLDPECQVSRYTMSDFRKISRALERVYEDKPPQILNGSHLGLPLGTRLVEATEDLSRISVPAVVSDVVWLPDPAYSFLVDEASRNWQLLPEGGSKLFTKNPGPLIKWRGLWDLPTEGRQNFARSTLPRILTRLAELEPLVRAGAVRLFSWEGLVKANITELQQTCQALVSDPDFERVATRHLQDQYNLGVRVGAIGIQAGPSNPPGQLAPGTPMWFVDKSPVALGGLLNLLVSSELGALFVPDLPGDRDVFDYIRSGGSTNPSELSIAPSMAMPKFSKALMPELAAIRKDSESLSMIRTIVSDAREVQEESALESIRDRLEMAANKLKEDKGIWKVVQGAASDVSLAILGGVFAGAVQETPLKIAALASAARSSASFLDKIYKGIRDLKDAKRRAEVLLRVLDRV